MIVTLNRLETRIAEIRTIPEAFFNAIEEAGAFGEHLFPEWSNEVFRPTTLSEKFRRVYEKYKAIPDKVQRDRIVKAFINNNKIEELCANNPGSSFFTLDTLHEEVRRELDELFLYLYDKAINYHGFEQHVNDNLREAINRFLRINQLEVCPFCGIESFMNLEGQRRIALDHWLCKDLFPMAAVNFDNLVPIGEFCNGRPAKGSTNVLLNKNKERNTAYYPYAKHSGICVAFSYKKEPAIQGVADEDWTLKTQPNDSSEKALFDSWLSTLNISKRYSDYVRLNIFTMWEADYKRFIEDDHDVDHADNIEGLKGNFKLWRASFPVRARPGSILYRAFINNLIENVSDAYLYGLCENFKRSKQPPISQLH